MPSNTSMLAADLSCLPVTPNGEGVTHGVKYHDYVSTGAHLSVRRKEGDTFTGNRVHGTLFIRFCEHPSGGAFAPQAFTITAHPTITVQPPTPPPTSIDPQETLSYPQEPTHPPITTATARDLFGDSDDSTTIASTHDTYSVIQPSYYYAQQSTPHAPSDSSSDSFPDSLKDALNFSFQSNASHHAGGRSRKPSRRFRSLKKDTFGSLSQSSTRRKGQGQVLPRETHSDPETTRSRIEEWREWVDLDGSFLDSGEVTN